MRISDWSSDVCSSDLPKGCQTHCQRQYGDWQHTLADAPEPERALRQWKTSQLTQMLGQKFQHALKHDHVSGTQDSIAQPFDQPLTRTGDRQKIKAISLMYPQPSDRSPNQPAFRGDAPLANAQPPPKG